MERVLVPLDGSALSEAIVPVAEALARDYGAELILLRAVRLSTVPDPLEPEAKVGEAEAYLACIAEELQARGLSRVRRSVWHVPAKPEQAIAEAAAQNHADLIAMTTHGRTGLGRLFFGSVAERVLRAATVPVLLWKPQEN